jgi:ferric-dicitrate binding protein FerR (iron transport regulator)
LPDGTSGWLNGNSKISYQGDFTRIRRVELDGEAYFNVISDPKRPFSVSASDITVQVLGTRFNVASYQNEKAVEVVLEEGSLALKGPEIGGSVHLGPNHYAVYDKTNGVLTHEMVNPQKYTAWKDGKLVFRNDPLDVIARRLGRWYNVDIVLNVSAPEEIRWRATFEDDSLEEVLKLMKRSLQIDYEITRSEVRADDTVSRRKVILSRMRK